MRITGGEWCGRKIRVPASDAVRPTQDRVRESLFSIVMHSVPGARFLDLFAGSGAVGLEALSRGAAEAFFVEADRTCAHTLRLNLAAFGVDPRAATAQTDAIKWVKACGKNRKFDIIFADPPYRLAREEGFQALAALACEQECLKKGGLLITETDSDTPAAALQGFECLRDRAYGHTRLAVYKRLSEEHEA